MDSTLRIIESDPLNADLPLELLDQAPVAGAPCYVRNHFGIPRVDPELHMGGTSMAAPHVAGAAALVLQQLGR